MCLIGLSCRQKGFTLVEVAIVLMIVGVVLAGTISAVSTQSTSAKYSKTKSTLNTAQEALLGYVVSQGRLPCPDTTNYAAGTDGDGLEDIASCNSGLKTTTVEGWLPFATLGIEGRDDFGRLLRYRVTEHFAVVDAESNAPCEAADIGRLTVQVGTVNALGAIVLPVPAQNVQNIAAVVFSLGNNGTTNQSASEVENSNNNATFFSYNARKDISNAAGNDGFDDMLVFISDSIIKSREIASGVFCH
jgi:prepilin-type N-terminal cleavage/methylation domain-containing protein